MWRVIYIENVGSELWWKMRRELEEMCRQAIDRSQGQLVDIKIEHIASDELLKYLADNKRSSQLRRLQIAWSNIWNLDYWSDLFQKSPLLEDICLAYSHIRKQIVRIAGKYCHKLESFRYRNDGTVYGYGPSEITRNEDDFVVTITKAMPQLHHLEG